MGAAPLRVSPARTGRMQRIDLTTPAGHVACAFACTSAPLDEFEAGTLHFLSARESARLTAMTSPRRRLGFLRGRRAAKDALRMLSGAGHSARLHIEPGAFGQPVVEGAGELGVTLSHTDDAGVALAFPLTHPLGIDIEQVRPGNERALRAQLTDTEIASFVTPASDPLARLTALWSIKEALSKLLGGGLAIDAAFMAVAELREEGGTLTARFAHIAHATARACIGSGMAMAIAMPHNAMLDVTGLFEAVTGCVERVP